MVAVQLRTQYWRAGVGDRLRTYGKRTEIATELRTHEMHGTQGGCISCMCFVW